MMRLMFSVKLGLILSLCSLLLACAGASPKPKLYTLNTFPAKAENNTKLESERTPLRIQVMPISIDETVDRPQIVITRANHQVDYLEQERWAQPLKYEIGRVLSMHLYALHANSLVSAYPHQLSNADIQVQLQVTAFISSYQEGATLKANITVINTKTKQSLSDVFASTQNLSAQTSEYISAIIDAHHENIVRLSETISQTINQMY
jgi:uncharacterized lipoprotein YmbA